MAEASDPSAGWHPVEISTATTHAVRRAVLRVGTPTTEVTFAEDEWPGAIHLGVFDDEVLVGTSTWIPREMANRPGVAAVQLRGMATLTSHQGRKVGAALLHSGLARAASDGAAIVWANARDAALDFYCAHGFAVIGEGFVDEATQLPHHRVVIETQIIQTQIIQTQIIQTQIIQTQNPGGRTS